MQTVTKIKPAALTKELRIGLQLRHWEFAALGLSLLTFLTMSWVLISDFSIRRILWPSSGEGSLARPIGKVTYSLNKTLRQARDQPEFIALSQNDAVYPLDTLMAGPGSALKITLDDKTVVEVGENSMIRLNFDTSLRLSGINRETVLEVVTGSVAAKGGDQAPLKVKTQDKTYTTTQGQELELSQKGSEVPTAHQGKSIDLIAQATATAHKLEAEKIARLAVAQATFSKLGGVMTANKGGTALTLPLGSKLTPSAVALRGGGSLNESISEPSKLEMAKQSKAAEEMMKLPRFNPTATRAEVSKAMQIEPIDNFTVKTKGTPTNFEFPVQFKWKAEPENASFTIKFTVKGAPETSVKVLAKEGDAQLRQVLRRPGDYTWKILDAGGSTLSVRTLHINSKFQTIELSDPVLVGRERGSKMWGAQDKWGFVFRWTPVKGVTTYNVRITRNLAAAAGEAPALAERQVNGTEFILPFNKAWQAERMFFSVGAAHPLGFQLASNNVPFIFTFLPPKPRIPKNSAVLKRAGLAEGAMTLNWETNSDVAKFTIEIANDPGFHDKLESETTGENEFRFYPARTGKFYWHVRGDKETLSSPFSETWEFLIQ